MLTLANANMFSGLALIFGLVLLLQAIVIVGWGMGVAALLGKGERLRLFPVASASIGIYLAGSAFLSRLLDQDASWQSYFDTLPNVLALALVPALLATGLGITVSLWRRRLRRLRLDPPAPSA